METLEETLFEDMLKASGKTAASWLSELGVRNGTAPYYQYTNIGDIHAPNFSCAVKMRAVNYSTRVFESYEAEGIATKKKIAQQIAAKKMLMLINFKIKENTPLDPLQEMLSNKSSVMDDNEISSPSSPKASVPTLTRIDDKVRPLSVSLLREFCGQENLPDPIFEELGAVGPSHCPIYTYKCYVGTCSVEVNTQSKKIAKNVGAHLLLEKLKSTPLSSITADAQALRKPLILLGSSVKSQGEKSEGRGCSASLNWHCSAKCVSGECAKNLSHIDHKFQQWPDDFIKDLYTSYKNDQDYLNIIKELGNHKDFSIKYKPLNSLSNTKNNNQPQPDYEPSNASRLDSINQEKFDYFCTIELGTYPPIVIIGEGHSEAECELDASKKALEHMFTLMMI